MSAGKKWTKKEIRRFADELSAVTVSVNIVVEAKQKILSLGQVEKLLRASKKVAVGDCECRTRVRGCDAPLDVCLYLDEAAKEQIKKGFGKEITLEQAIGTLKRTNEAGLVHLAFADKGKQDTRYICSCCSCCCHCIVGMQKYGFNDSLVSSEMIAVQNDDLCDDCGLCVERCHFKARRMANDHLVFDAKGCFGCGVCLTSCPQDAVSLEKRP